MKIYTKTGDLGKTSLIGGDRVDKDDLRVVAYGTVDELTANLAYLRDGMDIENTALEEYRNDLLRILNKLMNLESVLAAGNNRTKQLPEITDEDISFLENRIDHISLQLRPIDRFTVPGGHPLVSFSHICRTICRRAERTAVAVNHMYPIPENAIIYLNRLSDYLYQLGRKLGEELGIEEEFWEPEN